MKKKLETQVQSCPLNNNGCIDRPDLPPREVCEGRQGDYKQCGGYIQYAEEEKRRTKYHEIRITYPQLRKSKQGKVCKKPTMNRIQRRWFGEFENNLATSFIFNENSIRNSLKTSLP